MSCLRGGKHPDFAGVENLGLCAQSGLGRRTQTRLAAPLPPFEGFSLSLSLPPTQAPFNPAGSPTNRLWYSAVSLSPLLPLSLSSLLSSLSPSLSLCSTNNQTLSACLLHQLLFICCSQLSHCETLVVSYSSHSFSYLSTLFLLSHRPFFSPSL